MPPCDESQITEAQADLVKTNNLFGQSTHFNDSLNFIVQEGSEEGATIDYDIVQIDHKIYRSRRFQEIVNKVLEHMPFVAQPNCAYILTNFSF